MARLWQPTMRREFWSETSTYHNKLYKKMTVHLEKCWIWDENSNFPHWLFSKGMCKSFLILQMNLRKKIIQLPDLLFYVTWGVLTDNKITFIPTLLTVVSFLTYLFKLFLILSDNQYFWNITCQFQILTRDIKLRTVKNIFDVSINGPTYKLFTRLEVTKGSFSTGWVK